MPPLAVNILTGQLQAELTTYATGYRQNGLIADVLFPRVGAPKDTDRYIKFGRAAFESNQKDLRAKGAPANQIREVLSDDSYYALCHSEASVLAAEDIAKFVLGDLRQRRTRICTQLLLLEKEVRAAAACVDTGVITQYVDLSSGTHKQWSDPINSDPQDDVETGKNVILETGVAANTLVINPAVFAALKVHEQLKDAFKYVVPGAIGVPQLASFFSVDRVLIASGVKTSAAGVSSFVWPSDALLCFVDPAESMDDPSFGKTFVWESAPYSVGGFATITGPVGMPSALSEELSVHFWYDQKVTFAESAYLLENAA